MKTKFREAFISRFESDGTKVAHFCRQAGVSRHKINKLLRRQNDRVEVEDAIASFYGLTVEEFLLGGKTNPKSEFCLGQDAVTPAMERLSPEDQNRVRAYAEALAIVASVSELDADDRNRALGYIDALKSS